MEQSDSELVAAIVGGDQQALGVLYDRYADRLFGFCYSMLRDREEAADAVHDTIVKSSQKLDQLRDPTKLRPWLFAIARNEVISITRQRARMDGGEVPEMAAELPAMEKGIASTEIQSLVWEAAAGLQPRDQELLELNLREGLEGEELAAALGVKTSHVHVLMSRMRDRMQKSMGSLLVARLGRDECEDLNTLLEEWDGTFSLDVRSKVTRHIEKCDVCKKKRAAVLAPSSLASAMPLVVAPAALRERTLESLFGGSASPTSAEWAWAENGFPEPLAWPKQSGGSSAPKWTLAAGVALFVAAVVGAIAALGGLGSEGELTLVVAQPSPTETASAPTPGLDAAPTTEQATTTPTPEPSPTPSPEATATAAPTASPRPSGEDVEPVVPPVTVTPTPAPPTPTPTPRPPALGVTTGVLDFGSSETQRQATITNTGDLPLNWTATVTGAAYSLDTTSGQIPGGQTSSLVVRIDRSGFGEGDLRGRLTVNGPAGQSTVVSLEGSVEVAPAFLFVITTPPTIGAEGPTCGLNSVALQAEVMDPAGVASVVARFAPDGAGTITAALTNSSGALWVGSIGGIRNGAVPSLTITFIATDTRGNRATSTASVTVNPCT